MISGGGELEVRNGFYSGEEESFEETARSFARICKFIFAGRINIADRRRTGEEVANLTIRRWET